MGGWVMSKPLRLLKSQKFEGLPTVMADAWAVENFAAAAAAVEEDVTILKAKAEVSCPSLAI